MESPAIDAGTNAAVPDDVSDMDGDGNSIEIAPLDMAGQPRFMDGPVVDTGLGVAPIVDMGAFEAPNVIYLPMVIK